MKTLGPIIHSMRLRTLPLSLSGVICGVGIADSWSGQLVLPVGPYSSLRLLFLLLTTVCLQVLSNLSNELGDYRSGTDSADRQGPNYSLAQGTLDERTLQRLIRGFAIASCVCGIAMIYCTFGTLLALEPALLLLLGAAAVWAAMHYTLGKHPYGYRGWGDLFVFLFFGLTAVLGGYYIYAVELPPTVVLLPASAIGLFSVAVLNVNNIRDMATDAGTRRTIPLVIGERKAKIYHTFLILGGWCCLVTFTFLLHRFNGFAFLYFLAAPLYVAHLVGVWRRQGRQLDAMLPLLVMSTFALSLLLCVSVALGHPLPL